MNIDTCIRCGFPYKGTPSNISEATLATLRRIADDIEELTKAVDSVGTGIEIALPLAGKGY